MTATADPTSPTPRTSTRFGLSIASIRYGTKTGTGIDAVIAFKHLGTERRKHCATSAGSARSGRDDRLDEGLVHAVEQNPCALVVHSHFAGGGRDRPGVSDAFEQLRFAGADAGTRLEDDVDVDPTIRYCATDPVVRGWFQVNHSQTDWREMPISRVLLA